MSSSFAEQLQAGFSAHTQGRFDEAERCYLAAAAIVPGDTQLLFLFGSLCMQMGRLGQGGEMLEAVIAKTPDHVPALSNLGLCYYESGMFAKAETCFRRALDIQPDSPDLHRKLGFALLAAKQKRAAIVYLERVLVLQPRLAHEVYPALCGALLDLGRCYEVIRHAQQWALLPGSEQIAKGNEAMAWARFGFAGHAQSLVDSLEDDSSAGVLFCKAYVADFIGDHGVTIQYYRRCIELDPNQANAHFNLALSLFQAGELQEAWREFEWRFAQGGVLDSHGQTAPQWDGRPLNGSGVLVHSEQGIGDVLQFMRYFPLIQQRGGKVVFGSYPDVLSLLAAQDDSRTVAEEEVDLSYDWQIPLLSLGGVFSPKEQMIPAQVPYLHAPSAKSAEWAERFAAYGSKFKVGLVWAGNPDHSNDINRSAALADFAILASVPNTVFFSLQKGALSAQADSPPIGLHVVDLAEQIKDFTDTAAIIEQLDLVICVDTSVAHLAGALGRPVWLLLPGYSDWRWFADRQDSPWYPTMKIFRQRGWLQWPVLMQQVACDLGELVVARSFHSLGQSTELTFFDVRGRLVETALNQLSVADQVLTEQLASCLVYAAIRDDVNLLGSEVMELLPPLWRAEYYRSRGLFADAIDLLEHQCLLQGDQRGVFLLAQLYLETGCTADIGTLIDDLNAQRPVASFMLTYWNAQTLRYRKEYASASELYRQVLAISPRMASAHVNLALCYKNLKQDADALLHMQMALQVQRDNEKASYLAMLHLLEVGGREIVLTLAEQFNRLFPKSNDLQSFLATAYGKCGKFSLALKVIESMPEVLQHRVDVMWTKATCLWLSDRNAEAEIVYHAALAAFPDESQLRLNYAMFLLAQERWTEGWLCYEARSLSPDADSYQNRGVDIQPWQNEPLQDKTLLVYAEQGLGDTIQFIRFIPPGKGIILACQAPLIDLVRRNYPELEVIPRDQLPAVKADFAINLLSLPAIRHLGGHIYAEPYLTADPALYSFASEVYSQAPPGKRVGIIWAGNPAHGNDMHRSTRLSAMLPLLASNRDIVWCSFQKDAAAMQQALIDESLLPFDAVVYAENIEQTAALLNQIDLLITIDSAMAHLAAAIGTPVWLLNSKLPDWRWGREAERTPWYPTMRIFRQQTLGDWNELMERVNLALQQWKSGEHETPE